GVCRERCGEGGRRRRPPQTWCGEPLGGLVRGRRSRRGGGTARRRRRAAGPPCAHPPGNTTHTSARSTLDPNTPASVGHVWIGWTAGQSTHGCEGKSKAERALQPRAVAAARIVG